MSNEKQNNETIVFVISRNIIMKLTFEKSLQRDKKEENKIWGKNCKKKFCKNDENKYYNGEKLFN